MIKKKHDKKWRDIIRNLNKTFYHQTVTSQQIEDYLCLETGIDLTVFLNQYLRDTHIPTLEYSIKNRTLKYRWINIVDKLNTPVIVKIGDKEQWLYPKAEWQTLSMTSKKTPFTIDPNFYIKSKKII